MKISAKFDYTCRALIELSLHWPSKEPLQISTIAEKQKIPIQFLTHILINLKQLGYVESLRGKKGGYVLTKPPQEITLSNLSENFSELRPRYASKIRTSKSADVLESIWQEIDQSLSDAMKNINFEYICKRKRNFEKIPMYTI